MMRGVIYHALQGQSRWVGIPGRSVDVSRVLEIHCRARWFMLWQRDLPYELNFLYELSRPSEKLDFAPTVSTHGQFGTALTSSYEFDEWLTLRYPSEREAMLDLQAVLTKQRQLRAVARGLCEAKANEREGGESCRARRAKAAHPNPACAGR
jgi:hypothetical protein